MEDYRHYKKNLENFAIRYVFLLGIAFAFLYSNPIYNFLLFITANSANLILSLFYDTTIFGNNIIFNSTAISIIPACVAASAYFLLLILNLTTPMKANKRIFSILVSFLLLFFFNILRIVSLSLLLAREYAFFGFIHEFFWYFLSTLFVVVLWFLTAYIFKIKNIPVYSDIKNLLQDFKNAK
jgi:exosortase/archaeosortase family protein